MSDQKKIKMSVHPATIVALDFLNPFQGDLKTLSEESYRKLMGEIRDTGFNFTVHYWINPDDDKAYILDGHQRIATLRRMIEDGYDCPGVMAARVDADSHAEAKRKLLSAVSQYGKVTGEGLYEFLHISELDPEMLKTNFDIPDLDVNRFFAEFYDSPMDLPEQRDWDEITEKHVFKIKCDTEEELSIIKEFFHTQSDRATYAEWRSRIAE